MGKMAKIKLSVSVSMSFLLIFHIFLVETCIKYLTFSGIFSLFLYLVGSTANTGWLAIFSVIFWIKLNKFFPKKNHAFMHLQVYFLFLYHEILDL